MSTDDIGGRIQPDSSEVRRKGSFTQIVFGAILVVVGAGWLLSALDVASIPIRALLAAALIVVGVALVAGSTQGSHSSLITMGVILAVFLGMATTAEGILDVPFSGGLGERTDRITNVADLGDPHRLAIGKLTVDLGDLDLPPGETLIEASVTIGQLVIYPPGDAAIEVRGHVGAGELSVGGTTYSGVSVDEVYRDEAFDSATKRIVVQARVGLGQVQVER